MCLDSRNICIIDINRRKWFVSSFFFFKGENMFNSFVGLFTSLFGFVGLFDQIFSLFGIFTGGSGQ